MNRTERALHNLRIIDDTNLGLKSRAGNGKRGRKKARRDITVPEHKFLNSFGLSPSIAGCVLGYIPVWEICRYARINRSFRDAVASAKSRSTYIGGLIQMLTGSGYLRVYHHYMVQRHTVAIMRDIDKQGKLHDAIPYLIAMQRSFNPAALPALVWYNGRYEDVIGMLCRAVNYDGDTFTRALKLRIDENHVDTYHRRLLKKDKSWIRGSEARRLWYAVYGTRNSAKCVYCVD